MDFWEILEESSVTLTVNKVRTGLAMLGVVIGIGSVIALMSLGQSSQRAITDQIQALGSNLLTVIPGAVRSGGVAGAAGSRDSLTMADAEAVEKLDTVMAVAPLVQGNAQLVAGRNNTNTSVYGVTVDYAKVSNVEMERGIFISNANVSGISRVAVLSPDTVTELYGEGIDPVGENLRINGQTFRVIGVSKAKGGSGMMSSDDMVYVPISTAQRLLFGQTHLSSMGVSVESEDKMSLAQEQVEKLLLRRHRISDPEKADFRIMNQEDLLSTVSQVTGTFTALLAGIAAISLVVGGIGIMNIMLVTVTERTREIGLRKALGAKRSVIVSQFLMEAVLITVIGGLIGVMLGMGISLGISKVMSLPFTIAGSSVMLAFGVSVVTGVVFGWYPAQKASKLQPIEALRYE